MVVNFFIPMCILLFFFCFEKKKEYLLRGCIEGVLDKCHRQIETVIRSCIKDEIDCTTTEHTLKECFYKNEANMTKVSQCVTHVDDSHVDDFIASDEIQHLLSCATEHVEECELLAPSGKIKTELEERRRRRIW